ncbi:MAG TPA: methyltransferase domain-containing protein [Phycisphaerae bacterium]|nr:methyltransferase domain-containing protein [Phycisphaerae bacterium]
MEQRIVDRIPEPEVMDGGDEAKAYEQADFAEVNEAFVERIVELGGHLSRACVVDLGAGPADIAVRLLQRRPDWRVTAVDAAAAMFALARQRLAGEPLGDRIDLVLADAKSLPFDDHAFDLVVSNSIIHHLNEPESVWLEVKRVARPGAVVLFRDLSRPDTPSRARRIVETYSGDESDLLKKLFYDSLLAAYTPDEVRGQLAAANLTTLQVEHSSDRHWDVFGRV